MRSVTSSVIGRRGSRPPWRVSTGWLRPRDSITGAGWPDSPRSPATRAPSSVADITRIRISSRRPFLRIAGEGEAEIGIERALVEFVEDDEPPDIIQQGVVEKHAGKQRPR